MLYIQKFKHVIFDFDGVIVDSEKKKFEDLQKILKNYNFSLKNEEFKKFIGKKRAFFLKEQNHDIINNNIEEIMTKVHKKDFQIHKYDLTKGLTDFLTFLENKGIKMHIATGSSEKFVLKILEKFNIKKYFTYIITGDQVSESKPSPKVYLEIKNKINDEPAFVIEDSAAGILSAKRAGFFVISFLEHDKADVMVHNFLELLQIFTKDRKEK